MFSACCWSVVLGRHANGFHQGSLHPLAPTHLVHGAALRRRLKNQVPMIQQVRKMLSAVYGKQSGTPSGDTAAVQRSLPSKGFTGIVREDVIRAYRRYAPVYDSLFGRVLHQGRVEMASLVGLEPCARLLEVGVGTGLALSHYPKETSVWGIDVSPEMLAKAHEAVPAGRHVSLEIMDAESMTYPNETFDCVTAPYVLSVTPDPVKMLSEMQRVCRPGGRIIVLNHFRGAGVWSCLERVAASHASWFGFRTTLSQDVFDLPGLRIESMVKVNLFGLSRLVVIRNARS